MSEVGSWLDRVDGATPPTVAVATPSFSKGPVNPLTNTSHRYVIEGFNAETNPEHHDGESQTECVLLFQNGTIPEVGKNGVTPEQLLDVLIDRFEGFQGGRFACPENEQALEGLRQAKAAMQARTGKRRDRGVEGTHQV